MIGTVTTLRPLDTPGRVDDGRVRRAVLVNGLAGGLPQDDNAHKPLARHAPVQSGARTPERRDIKLAARPTRPTPESPGELTSELAENKSAISLNRTFHPSRGLSSFIRQLNPDTGMSPSTEQRGDHYPRSSRPVAQPLSSPIVNDSPSVPIQSNSRPFSKPLRELTLRGRDQTSGDPRKGQLE